MSWLNKNIYQLESMNKIHNFLLKNKLRYVFLNESFCIYNLNIMISIYEELGYLHLDFYDLKNFRWKRELDYSAISNDLIPLEEAKKTYTINLKTVVDDIFLSQETIASCLTRIDLIDKYMTDFICADFKKYNFLLEKITQSDHINKIQEFKLKFANQYEELF